MLGETASSATESVVSDLVLALLLADPELGCCPATFQSVRRSLPVRRAIVDERIKPQLVRHRLVVDYDDPTHRQLNPTEHHHVHAALSPDHFPLSRSGQHEVEVVEIFADHSLSTAAQQKLVQLLGYRPPCLAEARAMLDTVLRQTVYPVMAHCGRPLKLEPEQPAVVPTLQQVSVGRILQLIPLNSRWSQEYRLLAVSP